MPLTIFLVASSYFRDELVNRYNFIHGLHGILLAVPFIFFHVLIRKPYPGTVNMNELILHSFIYQEFQLFLLALFALHIPFGFRERIRERKFSASDEWQIFLFTGAFYSAVSIVDAVLGFGDYNGAMLFFNPLARVALVLSLSVLLTMFREETGIKKVLFFFASLVLPAAVTLGYPLFYLGKYSAVIPLLVICVAGSAAGFHFWMSRQYRPAAAKKSPAGGPA